MLLTCVNLLEAAAAGLTSARLTGRENPKENEFFSFAEISFFYFSVCYLFQ